MTPMVLFWAGALALTILLYVLLDGFDLGVGVLFGITRDESQRRSMIDAIAPVWDGNETWLVLAGATLFAVFPSGYALVMSAFYLPVIIMLAGLILRGVAFEFRERTQHMRWLWDAGFTGGSVTAAFMQGLMVGALVAGLPVRDGQYAGGDTSWLSPFAVLCGFGLVFGYTLLGAAWLVAKCDGPLRERAYRQLPWLVGSCAIVLGAVFVYAFASNLQVTDRWMEQPRLFVLPALGVLSAIFLIRSIRRRTDALPFRVAALGFVSAFATLAASFWPYLVPFSVTIAEAAAPPTTLSFMFWGAGIIVFPITLIYTTVNYLMFRGKTTSRSAYD
jgi:cytochrome bd ubiquinol oxidase subunit II